MLQTWEAYYYPFKRQSNKIVKHKQFVGNFPTNCLSAFDDFVILTLKGLYEEIYPGESRRDI